MSTIVHRLLLPLLFPEGVSPGEQRTGNHLFIARDGGNRPVLRGSALAGAIRHAWEDAAEQRDATRWFGQALEGDEGDHRSPLRVPDCLLTRGSNAAGDALVRTHNAIDRHRGSVLDGGLFSLEALPPGTRASVCLWLHTKAEDREEALAFLEEIAGLFASGLTLGGNAARGVGRAVVDGPALRKSFDCRLLDEHAAWLDEEYAWRCGDMPNDGEELHASPLTVDALTLEVTLAVPSAQDLMVGSGQGLDYEMEPQRVRDAAGVERWRIPGSALRGPLRAWITRLAARDPQWKDKVNDSLAAWKSKKGEITGDDLAWGHVTKERKKEIRERLEEADIELEELVLCPIMHMFGSGYSKSRLHISDAISSQSVEEHKPQVRAHVGVDRITGGANEGFLFHNTVLTGPMAFTFHLRLADPDEHEARWLYSALCAIDVGIVRIGSSKAGGRLALAGAVKASGSQSNLFEHLNHQED